MTTQNLDECHKSFILKQKSGLSALDMAAVCYYRLSLFRKKEIKMDREQVVALQHQRFATKKYDPNRRISQKDWEVLVEVGRLAPSAFGLEPWKMLLLKNERMKEDLKPMAWGLFLA